IEHFAGIKTISKYLVDGVESGQSAYRLNLYAYVVLLFQQHLFSCTAAANRRHGEAVLNCPARQISEAPFARVGKLCETKDYGCACRVLRLVVHAALIEVADRRFICPEPARTGIAYGQTDFFSGHARVMLSEHAVDVHVQLSRAGLVVLREG